jgi:hypothetical protein
LQVIAENETGVILKNKKDRKVLNVSGIAIYAVMTLLVNL